VRASRDPPSLTYRCSTQVGREQAIVTFMYSMYSGIHNLSQPFHFTGLAPPTQDNWYLANDLAEAQETTRKHANGPERTMALAERKGIEHSRNQQHSHLSQFRATPITGLPYTFSRKVKLGALEDWHASAEYARIDCWFKRIDSPVHSSRHSQIPSSYLS